jgi:cyclase
MITRRAFCQTSVALAATLSPVVRALAQATADQPFTYQRVRDGITAVLGAGGNVLIIESDDEVAVIDAKHVHFGLALHRACVEQTGRGPKLLINTHHHADHTGGNFAFRADTRIVAHTNAMPRISGNMERFRSTVEQIYASDEAPDWQREDAETALTRMRDDGAEAFMPHVLVSESAEDRMQLAVGSQRIMLQRIGNGHTDNDLVVHLPDANVVHTGDIVFHGMHPYMDTSAGVDSVGWQRTARYATNLCNRDTVVVPGHGDIGDKAILTKQIAYFDALREAMHAAHMDGLDRDAAVALEVEAVADLDWGQMLGRNLGVVYDEIESMKGAAAG